jgi:PAS domain S-box-containing protein
MSKRKETDSGEDTALQELYRHSQSLLRLSRALEQAQNHNDVLEAARKEVLKILGYPTIWVYLYSDDGQYSYPLAAGGSHSETILHDEKAARLTIAGDPMLEEIAAAKDIVVVEDARTDPRTDKEMVAHLGNRTIVNVPILFLDRHMGSFGTGTFGDEGVRVPTPAERDYLTALASNLAVTLDRLRLQRERKQAEQDLQEKQEMLLEAQSIAHIGNWWHDMVTNEIYWSEEFFKITGIEPQTPKPELAPLFIHPEDLPRLIKAMEESAAGKIEHDHEFRIVRPDGEIRWIRNRWRRISDAKGKEIKRIGTHQDITEHKLREQELERYRNHLEEEVQQRTAELVLARDAAEAANKAKSSFLANMSHELRTPLNAILGFSRMIRDDPRLNRDFHESLDIINGSGEHLLGLINDVLEMAKIEAGRLQLDSATFDLGNLIRDVIELMRVRCEEKGLKLTLDQSSTFPRYIRGDEGRLRQVLLNLLGNAVKFTEQGGVTVRLRTLNNSTTRLQIEVEDTGPGIRAEEQELVFSPFVQLTENATRSGTGLGLAISRQFIEMMGGHISVKSEPGAGALFHIELPLDDINESDISNNHNERSGRVIGLARGQPAWRILIAEDQRDNQLLLRRLMRDLGIEVRLAENGRECVELFRLWQPHLIWMDRRMPIMDGIEATRRIRQLPGGNKVKIIAVTASVFDEQRKKLLEAGMDDFVSKPYLFEELYDCMANHLGLNYLYADETAAASEQALPLTVELLASTTAKQLQQLRLALESLEIARIHDVLEKITSENGELGRALQPLVEQFDYPTILDLLDKLAENQG